MLINSAYGNFLATPYDFGAGVATISGSLKPGLVYETEITDYLQFLCSTGYNASTIKLISTELPNNFSCPTNISSDKSISNMNYPSMPFLYPQKKKKPSKLFELTNISEDEEESAKRGWKRPEINIKKTNNNIIEKYYTLSKRHTRLTYT
ncbi:hypothetical protein RND71_034799 [Anisodus tanguticus]|uniref:Uncharacterized protein n=1 Tax=Anisodus tanguticus TaxID=243964 RepID=A0AAE1R3V9_9SOLA|nr:hypothetical protein RND71_034799 [Anisodus tanguticus]